MLKNYIKIAWKVLLRRKFFTFISLFGISFTLMILMVATAFVDAFVGGHMPETKPDRTLYITQLKLYNNNGGRMINPASYSYMKRYVMPLKTPEKVSIGSGFSGVNAFANGQKLSLDIKFTDSNFWDILEFKFLEGNGYNQNDVDRANRVAVINRHTRDQYFGHANVVGKYMEVDQVKYRVIGVVEDVPVLRIHSFSDVWVPLTTSKEDLNQVKLGGKFWAILLAPTAADIPKVKAEYEAVTKTVQIPDPKEFNRFASHADGILENISRELFGDDEDTNLEAMVLVLLLVMILFMLMPTINLVNINVSRILERSSEIGVRKAFGASSLTLVGQFIVENIFLTLLGAVIGFLLSVVALRLISDSGLIQYAVFELNWRVLAYGVAISLFFGLISGVYPAYKMSRLQAVQALKGGSK